MRFNAQSMNQLLKEEPELRKELKKIMKEMELERGLAVKALYHTQVADGGKYQTTYQEIEKY